MRKPLAVATLVLALLGCEDDLPQATEIRHMRILGARVDVLDDEPGRATPRPGERMRVSFATVFPDQSSDTSESQLMLIDCTAPDRFTGGLPLCQEFLDLVSSQEQSVSDALDMTEQVEPITCEQAREVMGPWRNNPEVPVVIPFGGVTLHCVNVEPPPSVEIEVEDDFGGDNVLFVGVLCERGVAYVDPSDPALFGCQQNDGETLRIHGQIPVARDEEEENRHPSMEAAELFFDGRPWPAIDPTNPNPPPGEQCRRAVDDESVLLVDPLEHEIELRYDPAQRQTGPDGEPETLEFSVYATRPEVERRFTLFGPDAEPPEGESYLSAKLTWDPPSLPHGPQDPDSVSVRFYFTLLDQRGGFAIATRAVCLQ